GADDDIVELYAELGFLGPYFLGKADIAQAAKLVYRGAGRDRVGLAARCLDLRDGVLPAVADADIETVIDQPHVSAHNAAQHDVADPIVDRILVRYPGLLHQPALEADLGGNG